jgi:Uma2 family endonuclease
MPDRARKLHPATYADLKAVAPPRVAELIEGTLYTFPRPAPKHGTAEGVLHGELYGPFYRGRGGPGGWRILIEPELRFPDPTAPKGFIAVAPDLAGWRLERMPKLPKTNYYTLAPDWICEVLSPSTEAHDRGTKMPLYAREGVRHAWLVDPILRTLEVFRLGPGTEWIVGAVYRDDARVRAEPFEAFELELALLWAEAEGDDEDGEGEENEERASGPARAG